MRTALLVATALVGALRADQCEQCDGERFVPCAEHAQLDRDGLDEAGRAWKEASGEARIEVLQRVAELSRAHDNAPSAEVAKFLTRGLEDDSLEVRRTSIELLLDGQHPDQVVEALTDALDEAEKTWKALDKRLAEKSEEKGYTKGSGISREELQHWFDVRPYLEDVLTALGLVPDERTQKALLGFLERPMDSTPGAFYVAACGALIEQGSYDGMRAVIDFLPRFEKAVQKGKTGPIYERNGPGGRTLMDVVRALYRAGSAEDVGAIDQKLVDGAGAKGLPAVLPKPGDWKGWLGEHEESFARDLGRLTQPCRAKLPEREETKKD